MMPNNRTTYHAALLIAAGAALCAALSGCGRGEAEIVEKSAGTPVRVRPPRAMTFTSEIKLQGSLESVRFALVPARAAGTIERISVSEGSSVKLGQVLCSLDGENLRRVLESQEQELAVASNALAVAEAQAAQARAADGLARKDHARYERLAKEQVVSVQQMDQAENAAVTASAALDVAEAQVALSRARVRQASTAVAIARRNLDDATVRAPIDGVISIRHREQGEMVHVGDPVFRIDDPSVLEASVFVPATFYGQIACGRTVARIQAGNADLGERTVSYCSPTVDEKLRTFEVKVRIEDPPPGVVAGGLADVRVVLAEHEGLGVPAEALLTRNGDPVVFLQHGDRVQRAKVRAGIRTEGYLEIAEGIGADASVVVMGQQYLNDGDSIVVVED